MGTEVRRDSKRIRALRDLEEAWGLMAEAAKKGVKATRALQLVEDTGKKVEHASQVAQPTTLKAHETGTGQPKTLRDGLPANIRAAILRESEHLKKLSIRVRAVPITREQRVLANRPRRAASGGST